MAKYIQMIVVLAGIALASGLCLGGLNELTYEKGQNNILKYKKIPAVVRILEVATGATLEGAARATMEETLLAEKKYLDMGEEEPALFFVIQKEGKPYAVALENFGAGYGGALGVMVGFVLETGDLVGIGIASHQETPGVGNRVEEDFFTMQFRGMGKDATMKVRKDGGDIDAVSGATISSRAVAQALELANAFYQEHQEAIKEAINQ
jgi:electron transport complex protein RnfG